MPHINKWLFTDFPAGGPRAYGAPDGRASTRNGRMSIMSERKARKRRQQQRRDPRPGANSKNSAPTARDQITDATQHECGHAVALWALGSPFLNVTLNGPTGP